MSINIINAKALKQSYDKDLEEFDKKIKYSCNGIKSFLNSTTIFKKVILYY